MNISLIAAMDINRVIGQNNDLPWRLPRDWQHLKKITMGHPIILGRKNFESIGRPLPGRRNIILTRNSRCTYDGCEIAHTIEDVFELCKGEEEIFIFGGEQIYQMFLPYVERMYITKIHHSFEGDTYFPDFDHEEWKEVSVEKGITDEKNPFVYYFHLYERKRTTL
ncbi:dihydrofolate reductase [Bacillus sp. FJAT-50079]|uniref:dihydrofolate reductase n=1 Tax=Bacillus sp. FJAT-50079 TaxID=2833577 RepID=UPI001BCA25FD|nr:dihydrofolate reductase [Bacillus sp. FJAT-50079]